MKPANQVASLSKHAAILKGMLKSRFTIVVMFVKFELKIED